MELDYVIDELKNIICDIKEDENLKSTLTNSQDLINDIGLDSLQMITFMLEIENVFSIELDFEKINLSDLNSIENLGLFVSKQKKNS